MTDWVKVHIRYMVRRRMIWINAWDTVSMLQETGHHEAADALMGVVGRMY